MSGHKYSNLTSVALVSAAYIATQIFSDIASLRIVVIAGFSVDAGTLVYPFTFTLRDLVHKAGGIRVARALILAAAGINLFMAGLFVLVAWLPPDSNIGPQLEFGRVLAPTTWALWRIVVASIVAEVISELIDGEVYEFWVKRMGRCRQWARVLVSNGVSVPLDSAVFCVLAFGGRMPASVVVSIFAANVIAKGVVTLISLPMIYLVRERRFSLDSLDSSDSDR